MNNKSSRIQSNLLQQNCFVRDVMRADDLKSDSSSESHYLSLDEVPSKRGLNFEERLYPYPITPDYVNSFVDSSDFRRDPVNAINNGVNRINLGDISELQRILNMDTASQAALYNQLKAKFSKPGDPKSGGSKSGGSKPDNPKSGDPKPVAPNS